MRLLAVALAAMLLAGCTPPELRPLDYDPPAAARELYRFSPDRSLRYDGHWVHDEIAKQTAGDLETRTRFYAPPDASAPRVALVTVSWLGTQGYYDEVAKVIRDAKPDVVVSGVALRGDETDPRRARGVRDEELEKLTEVVKLFPGVTFPRAALASDDKVIPPQLAREDVAFVDSLAVALGKGELTEEEKRSLEELIALVGPDVVLHYIILAELLGPPDAPYTSSRVVAGAEPLEDGTPAFPSFEAAVAEAEKHEPPEKGRFLAAAFTAYRLPERCLEAMDLATASGARRVVLLVLPESSLALARALRARGYTLERERWSKALPLLTEHHGG